LVTPADVLEAIAGSFRSHDEGDEDPNVVRRADGSWLLSGSMPADEMADQLGFVLPTNRDYQTLAGFALGQFKRLPAAGETFDAFGWHFEVVDLDGRRIDKMIASRVAVRRVQP
jgi:putative hemolysin